MAWSKGKASKGSVVKGWRLILDSGDERAPLIGPPTITTRRPRPWLLAAGNSVVGACVALPTEARRQTILPRRCASSLGVGASRMALGSVRSGLAASAKR